MSCAGTPVNLWTAADQPLPAAQAGGAKPLHVALAMSKIDRQRKARLCSSEGRRCSAELPSDELVMILNNRQEPHILMLLHAFPARGKVSSC